MNEPRAKKHILEIKKLRFADSGIYECATSNNPEVAASQVLSKYFLNVTNPIEMQRDRTATFEDRVNIISKASGKQRKDKSAPEFLPVKDEPQLIAKTSGRSVRMKCRFQGDPKPQVTWQKDGHPFVERDTSDEFGTNRTDLYIENLMPKDSGEYTCLAKNKFGEAQFTYKLLVHSKY